MLIRIIPILSLTLLSVGLFAQTEPAKQENSLEGIEHIRITVNYASVLLQSSNTATLLTQHTVKVDGEDRPELRELDIKREGDTLYVEELKPNVELLKQRFPAGFQSEKGEIHFGKRVPEIRAEARLETTVEARLIVSVPDEVSVEVKTLYGSITAKGIRGLKRAYAKYGSLDIEVDESSATEVELESRYGRVELSLPEHYEADLKLRTEYGSLYTDFDINVDTDASRQGDHLEEVVGQLGKGGELISCNAPYGNVYLRKSL